MGGCRVGGGERRRWILTLLLTAVADADDTGVGHDGECWVSQKNGGVHDMWPHRERPTCIETDKFCPQQLTTPSLWSTELTHQHTSTRDKINTRDEPTGHPPLSSFHYFSQHSQCSAPGTTNLLLLSIVHTPHVRVSVSRHQKARSQTRTAQPNCVVAIRNKKTRPPPPPPCPVTLRCFVKCSLSSLVGWSEFSEKERY